MRLDKTDITIVLDRSGSMSNCRQNTIEAINSFINKQRESTDGSAVFSLIQFDDEYEVNYIAQDIKYAPYLNENTYVPRGMTKLNDAIGKAINSIGSRLRNTRENDRPGKVILVIQTDGGENNSKEFSREKINEMITHQRLKYNWDIIFLGADIDAVAVANSYNIPTSAALQYGKANSRAVFSKMSDNVNNMRSCTAKGFTASYSVSDEDRKEAVE